nr:MAG TPA: hypothetical protein [Caudoviricetes sp.]
MSVKRAIILPRVSIALTSKVEGKNICRTYW